MGPVSFQLAGRLDAGDSIPGRPRTSIPHCSGNFLLAPSLAQSHPAGAEEIVMGGVGMLSEVSVCGVSLWLVVSLWAPVQGAWGEGRRGDFKDQEWGWQEALRPWWVLVPKDSRHLITPK